MTTESILSFTRTPVADPDQARRIARLASLAFPDFFPDWDNPSVETVAPGTVGTFQLARLITQTADREKAWYGFYDSGLSCFLPLDREGTAFRYLLFFLNRANDIEVNWLRQTAKKELPFLPEEQLPVTDYRPVKNWKYVKPDELIRRHAQSFYKNSQIEQAWQCDLPFWNVGLLEIIFQHKDRRIQKYALFRTEADQVDHFVFLTGKSGEIYDLHTKDLPIEPSEITTYLKFFCWALQGDEGRFILPEYVHEISWERIPKREKWDEIHEKLRRPNPGHLSNHPESERTDPSNAHGVVAYGSAFFDARFHVAPETGWVSMTDDTSLLQTLPIKAVWFSTQKKPHLPPPETDALLPEEEEPIKYPQALQNVREKEGDDPVSAAAFLAILADTGNVTSQRVTGKVSLDDRLLERFHAPVIISGCWFDDEVALTALEAATEIRFTDCMFARSFTAKDSVQKKTVSFETCWFNDLSTKGKTKQGVVADFENYRSEGNLIFKHCFLFGELHAPTMKLMGNLTIQGCLVSHTFFSANPVRFTDMQSVIVKELKKGPNDKSLLKHVKVNGKKCIHSVDFIINTPIINIDNSLIKGNLEISVDTQAEKQEELNEKKATFLIGDVSARGIEVWGRTCFLGAFIVGRLSMENGTFHQDVDFNEFVSNYIQFRLTGDLFLNNCHIFGSLNLGYADIGGNADLYSIRSDMYINLLASHINKNLDLRYSVIKGKLVAAFGKNEENDEEEEEEENEEEKKERGDIFFKNRKVLHIGKDLLLSAAEIKHIHIAGSLTDGNVIIDTGHFYSISMCWGQDIHSRESPLQPFKAQSIYINSIKVQGEMDLSGIEIAPGRMDKMERLRKEIGFASCTIRASQIGSDLSFFNYREFQIKPDEKYPETIVRWGSLNMEANTIGGNLDLRRTWVKENIILDDTQIQLCLDADGFCRVPRIQDDYPSFNDLESPTSCKTLSMKRVNVSGNIFLTGLNTEDFIAKDSYVQGSISLNYTSPNKKIFTGKIHEQLNLTAAKINSINLNKENFVSSDSNTHKSADVRIILERAKVNKLTVHSELPGINLSDTKIIHWDIRIVFDDDETLSNNEKNTIQTVALLFTAIAVITRFTTLSAVPDGLFALLILYIFALAIIAFMMLQPQKKAPGYLQILDNMRPFEKSPYIDIETTLRNESYDEDANEIYRKMQKRARENYGEIRRVLDYLWYRLTGYGTRLWILLAVWVGVFLLTAIYVSRPGNHRPIPVPVAVGSCCVSDSPLNPDSIPPLNTGEALVLAANHCFPGIDFPADGKHIATGRTELPLDIVYVLSFILLSLFGVSVTARLIRGKQ